MTYCDDETLSPGETLRELQACAWSRSKDGGTVHRLPCRYFNPELVWMWAHRRFANDSEMLMGIPAWVKPCKVCFKNPSGPPDYR